MHNHQPPGPTGLPVLSALLSLWRDPLQFFVSLSTFGPISSYRIGLRPVYFVTQPDLVRELLINHTDILSKEELVRKGKHLIGEGLLTSWGEQHRCQRQQLSPAFHRDRIADYGAIVLDRAREVRERWQADCEIDVEWEMSQLAIDVVLRTLFSVESPRVGELVAEAITTIGDIHKLTALPIAGHLWWLPFNWAQRYRRGCRMLDEVAFGLIDQRSRTEKMRKDLLSILMEIVEKGTDDVKHYRLARDQIVTFILAGYGTVATLLTWVWYTLSQHPNVEKHVHREIDELCGQTAPTLAHLPHFLYTQMMLTEVLRLYPPVWVFGRVAERDFVLGGYTIRRKSRLLISPYVIHRNPVHFADAAHFDPLRWQANGNGHDSRFSYIPFGMGTRSCIGERFARMEALLIVVTLAQKWQLTSVSQCPVEARGGFTLTPKGGLRMRIRSRASGISAN